MTEQDLASLAPIDLLYRLRRQVDSTIAYVEHGMPMVVDHHLGRGKDQRLLWEIGDFVILARFTGGQNGNSIYAKPNVVPHDS